MTENLVGNTGVTEEKKKGRVTRRAVLQGAGLAAGVGVAGAGGIALGWDASQMPAKADLAAVEKKHVLIVGGSIAGLTVAAQLKRGVPNANITIVEPNDTHYYQPGFTLVGAGVYKPNDVVFQTADLMFKGIKWVKDRASAIFADKNEVKLEGGDTIKYDILVVATGVVLNPKSVEGWEAAMETPHVSNVYNWNDAQKWLDIRNKFEGGTALVHYPKGYIKCGGAPQKQLWLAEDYWRNQTDRRDKIDLHYFTPAKSIFPIIPVLDEIVTPMTEGRDITTHYEHVLKAIDPSTRTAIFEQTVDGKAREVEQQYDLFHAIPNFTTVPAVRDSDLVAEDTKGLVSVDLYTLQSKNYENVFALGDVVKTPAGKTAATIRNQAPAVVDNIIDYANGRELSNKYSGIGGCPLLTRYGRCMMSEFDYEGNLVNEELYNSKKETIVWWQFKVHGLKRMYRDVMLRGFRSPM